MISISKNVCIDKLDYIVNKYNNTYHRTIKMKPVHVKSSIYIELNKENNKQVINLKLIIMNITMQEHQNIKILLQKTTFQIDLKKFL